MFLQELLEVVVHVVYLLFSVETDMIFGLPFQREEGEEE